MCDTVRRSRAKLYLLLCWAWPLSNGEFTTFISRSVSEQTGFIGSDIRYAICKRSLRSLGYYSVRLRSDCWTVETGFGVSALSLEETTSLFLWLQVNYSPWGKHTCVPSGSGWCSAGHFHGNAGDGFERLGTPEVTFSAELFPKHSQWTGERNWNPCPLGLFAGEVSKKHDTVSLFIPKRVNYIIKYLDSQICDPGPQNQS